MSEAGHNFTFADPGAWQVAVTGSLLSHMGKHGPMLLIRGDTIPESVVRYLELVRPWHSAPSDQLVNHGWILGGLNQISWATQADLDLLLDARPGVGRR